MGASMVKGRVKRGQIEMEFRTHGGKRAGAGRKPKGPRAGARHQARPEHNPRHPVHVTMHRPGSRPVLERRVVSRLERARGGAGLLAVAICLPAARRLSSTHLAAAELGAVSPADLGVGCAGTLLSQNQLLFTLGLLATPLR